MATSEAARLDLYTGLADLLGPERAETLMAYLPAYDPSEIATKADIRGLETRLDRVEGSLAAINQRLDRLFLALVAGLFVVLAAMATAVFAVA